MFNVIKMDLFRLTKSKITFIFLAIMGCFMILSSYLYSTFTENGINDETVNEYGVREGMSQDGIDFFFEMKSRGEILTNTTTGSNLIFMLPAIFMVLFSGAYQRNNFIRNIFGYLPKKYELLVSNLVISLIFSFSFIIIAFVCASFGYSIFSPFYLSLPWGDRVEIVKFIFLYFCLIIAICTVTTLFTNLFQNQQISLIFAVLYGSGILTNMIGNICTTVFLLPDIRNYEPSSLLYSINLENSNYLFRLGIAFGVTAVAFLMSVYLSKNRDY